MEGLERLVSESFARHRVETAFDHRRLQWSPWFRCVDSVSLVAFKQTWPFCPGR